MAFKNPTSVIALRVIRYFVVTLKFKVLLCSCGLRIKINKKKNSSQSTSFIIYNGHMFRLHRDTIIRPNLKAIKGRYM
jgi:hypothetical protein